MGKRTFLFAFLLSALLVFVCADTAPGLAEGARITLLGGEELDWLCGVPFQDPGWEACGPDGEDCSAAVAVSGEVVAWLPGEYVLSYRLCVGDTPLAEAQRLVCVRPQELPEVRQPPAGTICLSFDDGPCEYTGRVLDILEKYGVKATFFIVASRTAYLDMLPRIAEAGHTVGIHCYDHSYGLLYRDTEHYFADLMAAQEVVHEYTGEYAHVLRFPGGSMTASFLSGTLPGGYDELYGMLHAAGLRAYDWNVQPESSTRTTEGTLTEFTHPRRPYEYAVVLQHDTRLYSVAALEDMIRWAQEQGYRFAPLDPGFPEIHAAW